MTTSTAIRVVEGAAPGSLAPDATRLKHHRSRLERRRARVGLALVSPALAFVVVFALVPIGFAIYMSFTNFPLVGPARAVGVANYTNLGEDPTFLHSVLFTLEYTAIVTPAIFLVGYGLAVFVRRQRRGSVLLRTLFFLPYVVGLVTESYLLYLELQPGTGGVNYVLEKLGITNGQTAWLVHSGTGLVAVCVLVVWYASGLTMLLLMAGMRGIPRDVYEAAAVDGAGAWARELRITAPLLKRTIALSLIISVIGSLLAFNQFEILTQGGPGTSTATIVFWIYQVAFVQLHLGRAAAMSIALLVLVGVITALQFYVLRERSDA